MKRETFISFAKPKIGEEEIAEVIETLKSGWLTTAYRVQKFQEDFKNFIGCKYALAMNSATAAIHLGLKALGIKEGDEVITTANSFVSTSLAILHNRAIPVFVDINKETYNIDENKIEEKITKKTKAILPVHYAGYPCEMKTILEIAKKYNLKVLEDAAHATETKIDNLKVGNISDATAFSFYATKNVICGEGGMLTTNSEEIARKVEVNTLHGIDRDAWKRYFKGGNKRLYDVIDEGYKYNMPDIQAAIGIHQLKKVMKNLEIRKKYWEIYNRELADLPIQLPPEIPENIVHSRHIYNIVLKPEELKITRNEFMNLMEENNVGTAVHFPAIHQFTYFKDVLKIDGRGLENTEYFCANTVSLPFTPYLTEEEVYYIARTVKKIIKENYKKK